MSDAATDIMDILGKHLEMDEGGKGKYRNKFMEPAKVEALLKDLWAYADKLITQSKTQGQKEMLCGLSDVFDKLVKEKQNELKLGEDEARRTVAYFNWEKKLSK